MSKNIAGIIILAVGVVLIVLGLQEYGALGSSLSRAIGRGPSTRAVIMLVCGGACAAFGAIRLFKK